MTDIHQPSAEVVGKDECGKFAYISTEKGPQVFATVIYDFVIQVILAEQSSDTTILHFGSNHVIIVLAWVSQPLVRSLLLLFTWDVKVDEIRRS